MRVSNADESELPWPRPGDDPFDDAGAEDWWHTAALNFAGERADFIAYATGYKLAADTLVAHIEAGRGDQDFLVFPILFNYRQYIELRLKYLIRYGRRLLDRPGDFSTHHRLKALWDECVPLLLEIEPGSAADVENAGAALLKFAEVDPESFSFRYPMDKKGGRSLPADLTHINLRHVRDVVERLAGFLDAALEQITVHLDWKHEMEAEYRP